MGTAEQVALTQQYGQATVQLRDAVVRTVDATWLGLGSYREADVGGWLDRLVPLVDGSLAAMVRLTDAYLTTVLTDMLGIPVPAGLVRPSYPRPVPLAEVYRRPFVTTWTSLSKGGQVSDAIGAGRARAVELVTTDLQLAKRDATHRRLAAEKRVVGYRRVLTGSSSCAMCALAARQRYHKERLMPIHPGCNCGVSPLVGHADPGQQINAVRARDKEALDIGDFTDEGDLDALNAAIAKTFGPDAVNSRGKGYADLVVTHEHGELGPVLTRRGDKFTSADQI